jgi:hypothetical protein
MSPHQVENPYQKSYHPYALHLPNARGFYFKQASDKHNNTAAKGGLA